MNGTQSIYKDTHMSAQARVHREKSMRSVNIQV